MQKYQEEIYHNFSKRSIRQKIKSKPVDFELENT